MTIGAVVLWLGLSGCGKSGVVVVKRPAVVIYACDGRAGQKGRGEHCRGPFDAGRLVGLRMKDAERLAEVNGFTVRCENPGEAANDELDFYRIDVECSENSKDGIITRVKGRG
jgi:hypothetical protein